MPIYNTSNQPTIKVQVYLPDQIKAPLIAVTQDVTIRDILKQFNLIDRNLVVCNNVKGMNQTPLTDFDKTLEDYNQWFLDKNYISELYLFNKKDTHLYDKERYDMYCTYN